MDKCCMPLCIIILGYDTYKIEEWYWFGKLSCIKSISFEVKITVQWTISTDDIYFMVAD